MFVCQCFVVRSFGIFSAVPHPRRATTITFQPKYYGHSTFPTSTSISICFFALHCLSGWCHSSILIMLIKIIFAEINKFYRPTRKLIILLSTWLVGWFVRFQPKQSCTQSHFPSVPMPIRLIRTSQKSTHIPFSRFDYFCLIVCLFWCKIQWDTKVSAFFFLFRLFFLFLLLLLLMLFCFWLGFCLSEIFHLLLEHHRIWRWTQQWKKNFFCSSFLCTLSECICVCVWVSESLVWIHVLPSLTFIVISLFRDAATDSHKHTHTPTTPHSSLSLSPNKDSLTISNGCSFQSQLNYSAIKYDGSDWFVCTIFPFLLMWKSEKANRQSFPKEFQADAFKISIQRELSNSNFHSSWPGDHRDGFIILIRKKSIHESDLPWIIPSEPAPPAETMILFTISIKSFLFETGETKE